MQTMTQRQMTDPATWATAPTGNPATTSGDATGPMSHASIAANECHPAATGGGASVATPIGQPLIENESNPLETSTNTKRHTTVTTCEHCGDAFTPRRPHGRFCSAYCRRLAWLERNPAKAAELAERDRQRWREHVIGCGGEWRE